MLVADDIGTEREATAFIADGGSCSGTIYLYVVVVVFFLGGALE